MKIRLFGVVVVVAALGISLPAQASKPQLSALTFTMHFMSPTTATIRTRATSRTRRR